jgi:transcriptional regulator with XRE-family HTH domain
MKSLRQARKDKGYILKAVSGLTGLTVPHLSWIETGKIPPSFFTLKCQGRQYCRIPESSKFNAGYGSNLGTGRRAQGTGAQGYITLQHATCN